ncbi:MAG: SOS response-associated peptidase [Bacteroidota bacterium]
MCGRYTLTQPPNKEKIALTEQAIRELKPRFNIAPSQYCPVISQHTPGQIQYYRWGLIPHWAKDLKIGYRMINARAETLADKPAFKSPLSHSRCLVMADGFYEWKKEGKGKQPFRIKLTEEEVFTFAGLTSRWRNSEGEDIYSFTIITTEPNELMAPIHNRMPAILNRSNAVKWLDPNLDSLAAQALLKPYPTELMKAFPVGNAVGNVRNDTPDLIEPIT